jgi:hypothetical protein
LGNWGFPIPLLVLTLISIPKGKPIETSKPLLVLTLISVPKKKAPHQWLWVLLHPSPIMDIKFHIINRCSSPGGWAKGPPYFRNGQVWGHYMSWRLRGLFQEGGRFQNTKMFITQGL